MRDEHIDEPFREFPIRSFLSASRGNTGPKPISCSKMASGLICHGGFEPHAWGVASLMDVTVLVVASLLVWLLVNRENHYA